MLELFGINAMPLLGITPSNQSRTNPVTSTVMKSNPVPLTPVASTSMGVGTVADVIVASSQFPCTATTSNVPLALVLLTNKTRVAFVTSLPAMLAGNAANPNLSKTSWRVNALAGPMIWRTSLDFRDRATAWAGATVASSLRTTSVADNCSGQKTPPNVRIALRITLFVNA